MSPDMRKRKDPNGTRRPTSTRRSKESLSRTDSSITARFRITKTRTEPKVQERVKLAASSSRARRRPSEYESFLHQRHSVVLPANVTQTFSVRKPKPKPKPASKSQPNTKAKVRVTMEEKPAEPEVQVWRPAGGERIPEPGKKKEAQITHTLGIARLATWKLEEFMQALRPVILQHGVIEDVATEDLLHGGESVTDVYVRFRSELVAEVVKANIDGEVVHGRKLQVKYA